MIVVKCRETNFVCDYNQLCNQKKKKLKNHFTKRVSAPWQAKVDPPILVIYNDSIDTHYLISLLISSKCEEPYPFVIFYKWITCCLA